MTSNQQPELVIVSLAAAKAQGFKRYFTGVPCKNGHVAERAVSGNQCIECSKAGTKRHRQYERITNSGPARAKANWLLK